MHGSQDSIVSQVCPRPVDPDAKVVFPACRREEVAHLGSTFFLPENFYPSVIRHATGQLRQLYHGICKMAISKISLGAFLSRKRRTL